MPTHLTQQVAARVLPGGRLYDFEPKGFGVRGTPSGPRWFLRFQLAGRRTELVIGLVSSMRVEKARGIAREARADIARGICPIAKRRDAGAAETAKVSRPTLAAFSETYLREHATPHKKASSVASDRNILKVTVLPRLGALKVADIGLADVKRFHAALRKTPYRANRALALLSVVLAKAEAWGERPLGSNPCPAIDRYPEKKRERFLTPAEAKRLVTVLDRATGALRDPADAVHLLLLTGCRKSEIVTLAWNEVDLEARYLRLSDSKTGRRTIPLGDAAAALLKDRFDRRISNVHVFTKEDGKSGRQSIDQAWRALRNEAKLPDVRLHDLRHSFAAAGIAAGNSLPEIGALMGHRAAATTQRYAHIADEVARAAATRTAEHLEETTRTGKPRLRAVR